MKLKIQTITGVTHDVDAEESWTIKDLKKEIYRSGKITGAVRILKGQEILPDDSTLLQHNISDGDTVNIVIEPEKQIAVDIVCKWGTFKHQITNSILVKDLKQILIESEQVGFLPSEFDFKAELPKKDAEIFEDDDLPLQHYGIQDNCKLAVVKPYFFLTFMDEKQSRKIYKKILKKTTVQELKSLIKELFFGKKVADISLFATNDQIKFVKITSNKDTSVEEVLSDDQTVCYLEDKCDYSVSFPVKLNNLEIGKVYGDKYDSEKTVKLRVQDQLSIPASRVKVTIRTGCCSGEGTVIEEIAVRVDNSFPLRHFAIQDDGKLVVDRPYIFLLLMHDKADGPEKVFRKLSKKTSVRELKDIVRKLFCNSRSAVDFSLFATKDETKYLKVSTMKDVSVEGILSDGQTICYIEDKHDYTTCWSVKNEKVEIGKVYADKEDTVRTIRLRAQDQIGIPASCISVSKWQRHQYFGSFGVSVQDNEKMTSEYKINVKICKNIK